MTDKYTFGDGDRAAARLARLAGIYEPVTRELLARSGRDGCGVAVDLGCGPGWSTRLLHDALGLRRTLGLDASQRYVDLARRLQRPPLEFAVHDVTRAPFPARPDLLLCRFLLTHLRDTRGVLAAWGAAAAPGATLLVHETEVLTAEHPVLARYYELVAALQREYGQALDVGAQLDASFDGSPWRIRDSRPVELALPAATMAELHLANLRTWKEDPHAQRRFDGAELLALDAALARIVSGEERVGPVRNVVRQVVAELER